MNTRSSLTILLSLGTLLAPLRAEETIFPALGATPDGKTQFAWNRFYDAEGLNAILKELADKYPDLTERRLIGKSQEGRELWLLELTAKNQGDPSRKPAMWIDGNVHGNEVQAGEVVAYTAWYLCSQHARLPKVQELLKDFVFYLVPSINPDGRDSWFKEAHTQHSSRTGRQPVDDDRDGLIDEDDADDLNGDGSITMMRKRDPEGEYKRHPDYPDHLMVRVKPGEKGEFTLLGMEGIDNDGDGAVNEDGPGVYDPNRDWAWDWAPSYIQRGARPYPFYLPESRAVRDFALEHPNIAAMQSYHNFGAMILRPPGRQGGTVHGNDERVMQAIAAKGEQLLPYYRSMIVWKDLYTVWGGEFDWFYGALGVLSFTNELWTPKNLTKGNEPSEIERHELLKDLFLGDGIVEWAPFQHPLYGEIEIGGTAKTWGRVPPSFLLEEECHRNMAFTLFHADSMPRLSITGVETKRLDSGLYRVWVSVENRGRIPTRSSQAVVNKIGRPDLLEFRASGAEVLSAGLVTDKYLAIVEPVPRRPSRIEIDSLPGNSTIRYQFIVSGSGDFTLTLDSEKGNRVETQGTLR